MSYPFRHFPDQKPIAGGKQPKLAFVGGLAFLLAMAAPAGAGGIAYAAVSFTLGFPHARITVGPVIVGRNWEYCEPVAVRREVVVEKVVTRVPIQDEYVDENCPRRDDEYVDVADDDDGYVVERHIIRREQPCPRPNRVVIVERHEERPTCDREIRVVQERPACNREVRVVREEPRCDRNVVVVRSPEREVVVDRSPQREVVVVPTRPDVTVIRHDNGRHYGWDKQGKENHDNGNHRGWDKNENGRGNDNRGENHSDNHGDRNLNHGDGNSRDLFHAPSNRPSRERGVRIGR